MFSGIKRSIQNIRYGDMGRRKRWLIGAVIGISAAILVMWVCVFGIRTAAVPQTARNESAGSALTALSEMIEAAKQVSNIDIGAVQTLAQMQEATTTPTASPEATVIQLQ